MCEGKIKMGWMDAAVSQWWTISVEEGKRKEKIIDGKSNGKSCLKKERGV
jgi:hypothetical protein